MPTAGGDDERHHGVVEHGVAPTTTAAIAAARSSRAHRTAAAPMPEAAAESYGGGPVRTTTSSPVSAAPASLHVRRSGSTPHPAPPPPDQAPEHADPMLEHVDLEPPSPRSSSPAKKMQSLTSKFVAEAESERERWATATAGNESGWCSARGGEGERVGRVVCVCARVKWESPKIFVRDESCIAKRKTSYN